MLDRFPEFQARLEKFLRDHGHREVDFDAYSATWLELPWVVLDNVRLILQTPMDQNPTAKERELKIRMQQAELEMFQKLPPDLHFSLPRFFGWPAPIRASTIWSIIKPRALQYRCAVACGNWAGDSSKRGVLSEAMDIFFAHRQQIDEAIARGQRRRMG
jgi:rifampicin phosphotransferase